MCRAVVETVEAGSSPVLVAGDLEVDVVARSVRRGGEEVALTAREFELLAFLMRNPDRAFRREELLEKVWGYTFGDTSTVTVHVRRLREKIEVDPSDAAPSRHRVGRRLPVRTVRPAR